MSALTNKHLLVVGDKNSQILGFEQVLSEYGVMVDSMTCESLTPAGLEGKDIDVIVINYSSDSDICKDALNVIRKTEATQSLPVLALVEANESAIQEILSSGVADFMTPGEDVHSMVQKIKAFFGEGYLADNSAIDITPTRATTSAKGIKVYIVEDDPLLRNLLSVCLQKSSFPHEFSNDGHLAINSIRQFMPDVIILDLMLPGKSGFEVLEEIKADDAVKHVPVIVFSNRDGQDDRRKAKELGAVGFYVKAMTDLSELVETIESLVS